MTGGHGNPQRFVPERYRRDPLPDPVKSAEQIDRESEIGWKVIEHWITGGAK